MRRRHFLGMAATLGVSTAGCQGLFETQRADRPAFPPVVEDRPDGAYVPSHVEGMQMAGTATAGRYRFALSYSYPHRFWLITGDRTRKVEIREADSVHLMLTAWDVETETVIPTSSTTVTVDRDGERIVSGKSLWPMLSQNMGVHFGDNVELAGDGTYEVSVAFGPVETRRVGPLAGSLDDRTEASTSLEFSADALEEVSYRRFDDRKGKRDAVPPMEMGMLPSTQVPERATLPGTVRGTATTGDARFVVTTMPVPDGLASDGTYLAVSARTPHNRYPLPFMTLSATLSRSGATVFSGDLADTLHPDLGYHYGAVLEDVRAGDDLELSVGAPPQIARHEGYETAFVTMPDVSLTL